MENIMLTSSQENEQPAEWSYFLIWSIVLVGSLYTSFRCLFSPLMAEFANVPANLDALLAAYAQYGLALNNPAILDSAGKLVLPLLLVAILSYAWYAFARLTGEVLVPFARQQHPDYATTVLKQMHALEGKPAAPEPASPVRAFSRGIGQVVRMLAFAWIILLMAPESGWLSTLIADKWEYIVPSTGMLLRLVGKIN